MLKRFAFMALGVLCWHSLQAQSPYVTRVLDFCPAPGQFVNELPEYEPGDDKDAIIAKAEEYIVGEENGGLLHLGSWGGYVVVGFDHTIVNVPGQYDFKVSGNAFYAAANPRPDAPKGGSCEPGIVMVSRDVNGNGLADDPWYELAGSEYAKPETLHNYEVVYYKPKAGQTPVPSDNPSISDTRYIRWRDNRGASGYVEKNVFHAQSYWPEWIEGDTLLFSGSRLADNGIDESGEGNYFVLYAKDWGYADNHPNTSELANFKIDWAVDTKGNPVQLAGIDFVKIYTGVLQMNGWLGECSTEISGVTDLHPGAQISTGLCHDAEMPQAVVACIDGSLHVTLAASAEAVLYTSMGQVVMDFALQEGFNAVSLDALPAGTYILQIATAHDRNAYKIIKH